MTRVNIHPSSTIGPDVVVAPDAIIGANCYIEGRTKIGTNTKLVGGITLIGDAEIANDCLIEPGVTITKIPGGTEPVVVGAGTRVGAGSFLAQGVNIGANVCVEVGAFVCRNVPAHAIVRGNPAAIVGYDVPRSAHDRPKGWRDASAKIPDGLTDVEGVRFYNLPMISDARGDLCVGEFDSDFPFTPKRYFIVLNVPGAANRGEHAHKECQELLVCLRGSVIVVVDDGTTREEFELNSPTVGLCLAPMVWRVQYKYSLDCVLLVLASSHYDENDYIRDYDNFLMHRRTRG